VREKLKNSLLRMVDHRNRAKAGVIGGRILVLAKSWMSQARLKAILRPPTIEGRQAECTYVLVRRLQLKHGARAGASVFVVVQALNFRTVWRWIFRALINWYQARGKWMIAEFMPYVSRHDGGIAHQKATEECFEVKSRVFYVQASRWR
jgi:hypothetical protein